MNLELKEICDNLSSKPTYYYAFPQVQELGQIAFPALFRYPRTEVRVEDKMQGRMLSSVATFAIMMPYRQDLPWGDDAMESVEESLLSIFYEFSENLKIKNYDFKNFRNLKFRHFDTGSHAIILQFDCDILDKRPIQCKTK